MYIDDDKIYLHSNISLQLMEKIRSYIQITHFWGRWGGGISCARDMCHIVNFEFTAGLSRPFWDRVQGPSKLGKLSTFWEIEKIAHLEEQN